MRKLKFRWISIQYCASFETAAARPPQDEEVPSMPSEISLMLRSAPFETPPAAAPQDKLARLEARTAWKQRQ
jgi:hypothetical protein